MAKNSGSTRQASGDRIARVAPPVQSFTFLQTGSPPFKEALRSLGHQESDIEAVFQLFDQHGGNSSQQAYADPVLFDAINDPSSPIGRVLRDIAAIEVHRFNERNKLADAAREKDYDDNVRWALQASPSLETLENAERWARWDENRYKKDIDVFRGGGRKNVEAWTTDERGAWTGSGRIGIDHRSSVKELLKTHYMIGLSFMVGAPGEAEIMFIKKKK